MPDHSGPSEAAIRTVLENFEQQRQQQPQFSAGDPTSNIVSGAGEFIGAVAEAALVGLIEGLGSLGS